MTSNIYEKFTSNESIPDSKSMKNSSDTNNKVDLCKKGQLQSPININSSKVVNCTSTCDLKFFYKDSKLQLLFDYTYLLANYDKGSYVMYNDNMYVLEKISFHIESNHKIDNYTFPIEINLNHRSTENNKLLIISILGEINDASSKSSFFLDNLQSSFQKIIDSGLSADLLKIDVNSDKHNAFTLIPEERAFYSYNGSLTRPPCSENVQWIIMENTINISTRCYDSIKKILHNKNSKHVSSKPTQPLNDRVVYYSKNESNLGINNNGNDLLCFTKKQFKEACPCLSDYQKLLNKEKQGLGINKNVIIITIVLFICSMIGVICMLYLAKEGYFDSLIDQISKIFTAKTIEKSIEYMSDSLNDVIEQIPKIEAKDVGDS